MRHTFNMNESLKKQKVFRQVSLSFSFMLCPKWHTTCVFDFELTTWPLEMYIVYSMNMSSLKWHLDIQHLLFIMPTSVLQLHSHSEILSRGFMGYYSFLNTKNSDILLNLHSISFYCIVGANVISEALLVFFAS